MYENLFLARIAAAHLVWTNSSPDTGKLQGVLFAATLEQLNEALEAPQNPQLGLSVMQKLALLDAKLQVR